MDQAVKRDWHLQLGVGLTFGWLVLSALYVFAVLGFQAFLGQGADQIGGFLEGAFAPLAFREFLLATEIRRRHTDNFLSTFDRMLEAGSRCDPEGFLRDALRGSAHGTFYRIAREHVDHESASV